MKSGDCFICKKGLIDNDRGDILIKNKKYKISQTGIVNSRHNNPCIQMNTEYTYDSYFFLENRNLKHYDKYFYDYFYTEKELRKLKLKKIENE